jgi:hypothetical protein
MGGEEAHQECGLLAVLHLGLTFESESLFPPPQRIKKTFRTKDSYLPSSGREDVLD